MKRKAWLVMVVVLVMAMAVCTGCTGDGGEATNSEAVNSEVVSEEVSEVVSEEVSEQVSEEKSEEVVEEQVGEPTIVNDILTFEEAQAFIENLKTLYPDMTEEEIVTLFVNFNIHSLDADTIDYYTSNYDCNTEFKNILSDKFFEIANTVLKVGTEYKDTWNLADFITNEELKKFAEEIETYLCEIKTVEQLEKYCKELNDYMYGTNNIGFTFDYNSEQRENTDLDGICFFIARFNFQYNSDNIGFSDLASKEALYTPVEEYQMEQGIAE